MKFITTFLRTISFNNTAHFAKLREGAKNILRGGVCQIGVKKVKINSPPPQIRLENLKLLTRPPPNTTNFGSYPPQIR